MQKVVGGVRGTYLEFMAALIGLKYLRYTIIHSIMTMLKQTRTMAAMVVGGYADCRAIERRRTCGGNAQKNIAATGWLLLHTEAACIL